MELRKILWPTDFSEFSEHALEHAVSLASAFEAAVTAIHVVPQTLMHPELFPYLEEPIFLQPEIRERAQKRLEKVVSGLEVEIEARLESGDAARRILMSARSLSADLVVMGTHGRGGFQRWILGSVAEKVVQQATCAVLTVTRQPSGHLYERILCPVDFSECSLHAVKSALALTAKAGGELILAHVVEGGADADEKRLRRRLAAAVPASAPEGCRYDFVVLGGGKAHREIRRITEERGADLIVLGARGASGGGFPPVGAAAHQLVRTAPCPVWIEHEPIERTTPPDA